MLLSALAVRSSMSTAASQMPEVFQIHIVQSLEAVAMHRL